MGVYKMPGSKVAINGKLPELFEAPGVYARRK